MLRIISLIVILLSNFKFHRTGIFISYILYTISLFNNNIYLQYNWFNINNISFDFEIYFGITETIICSIICLILTILHYSADILYKHDKYINNKLRLLNFFAFSMCIAICSNNMWQFYISIELLGFISSIFVAIENNSNYNNTNTVISNINTNQNKMVLHDNKIKIKKDAIIVYAYNKFASIIFLIGTINYLINNKCDKLSIICFTIACLCKSAQIPFSNWLIRATSANTLASILIHCATIIGIGVIFINKFYFLFEQYQFIMNIILIISICTSIIYPIIALYETNIKKIMAYLTISSTGTMFALCALKYYSISINYFLCHAFFKSLLFLVFAYYIEYFRTKNIDGFKNIKCINTVGLIAILSSIGIPPFICCIPKFIICDTLHSESFIIKTFIELSNCLMDIVIFKLYLQYFKQNENSIIVKFNIKPMYSLIILSIIYGFIFIMIFQYSVNNMYTSILENAIVILLSYIIARNTSNMPFSITQTKIVINHDKSIKNGIVYLVRKFNIKQTKLYEVMHYSNIIKLINNFNNKIEQFYKHIIYDYNYKLAKNMENINNSKYNNQIKHLLIGIVIVCIILFF